MARCMMEAAGLPKQFWPCALTTSSFMKNRGIHFAHKLTPYEMFYREKTRIDILQPLGCRAFVSKENRKKLDSNAEAGIFLGYSSRSKCL